MAKNEDVKKQKALEYNMLTMGIKFTDGGIETLNFDDIDKCFDHIKNRVKGDYVDNVRVALF